MEADERIRTADPFITSARSRGKKHLHMMHLVLVRLPLWFHSGAGHP